MRRDAGTEVLDAATSYEQSPWKQGLDQSLAARTRGAAKRRRAKAMVNEKIMVRLLEG
jgi:hypothetical protein